MNKKCVQDLARIIQLFTENVSVRGTSRITGIAVNTILDNMCQIGMACEAYQDIYLKNLDCKRLQVDETYSFVYSKEKNTPPERKDIAGAVYTWTAICQDTKLVPTWLVATREGIYANKFMKDLSKRLKNRVQLTTDGHQPYPAAVELSFGSDIDYARLIKNYNRKNDEPFIDKRRVTGNPNPEFIMTNHVERQNLTMRMCNRRLSRKTNAFSKKIENHKAFMALYFMYYNFVRIHQSLRVTPAMEAGITDRLWSYEDIAELAEWKFKVV